MRKSSFIIGLCLLFLLSGALIAQHTDGLFSARQHIVRFVVAQSNQYQTRDFEVQEKEFFSIKYLSLDERSVDLIAEGSERSYHDVVQWFGWEPSFQPEILVYPNSLALARHFGWDRDQASIGVYWGGSIHILSPSVWMESSDVEEFYCEGPMVHEMVHWMVDEMSGGNYARWFTEGMAQYLEKQMNGFSFPRPFDGQEFPHLMRLSELEQSFDGEKQDLAYWQALYTIEYIVSRYGEESLHTILAELASGQKMPQALTKVLDTDLLSFEQDCRQYIELELYK